MKQQSDSIAHQFLSSVSFGSQPVNTCSPSQNYILGFHRDKGDPEGRDEYDTVQPVTNTIYVKPVLCWILRLIFCGLCFVSHVFLALENTPIIIIMEICQAPTLRWTSIHIMYIETENVIVFKRSYVKDARTHARKPAHTHARTHTCARARAHTHTHTHIRARTHTHMIFFFLMLFSIAQPKTSEA